MRQPDQSNRQESAARVVEGAFRIFEPRPIFEPGPGRWELVNMGIKNALNTNIQGLPAVFLSHDNRLLHKGLSGAWHYPVNASGMVKNNQPEKDEISHPCDAWANAVCVLLPTTQIGTGRGVYRRQAQEGRKRIESYAVGGGGS